MRIFNLFVLLLLPFMLSANDSITGKWRGAIIGHIDNKDYFINATIDSTSVTDAFTVKLKVFSSEYEGEFVLNTTRENKNRLYIDTFKKVSEFPYALPHMADCFTGYFQLKRDTADAFILDLYRNPVLRDMQDFSARDSAGNFVPAFECFTGVLLHPVTTDTAYMQLEKKVDSIIAVKKNASKEFSKRKVVSSKEWTVKQEKIILQLWDNNKADGDIISLKFNDKWILSNFLLKKEKYTIELELTEKNNYLLMFAENLGSIPPNTASVSIDDDILIRTFILNSDMSKSETVKIILSK